MEAESRVVLLPPPAIAGILKGVEEGSGAIMEAPVMLGYYILHYIRLLHIYIIHVGSYYAVT
jgi:hypothetical protein